MRNFLQACSFCRPGDIHRNCNVKSKQEAMLSLKAFGGVLTDGFRGKAVVTLLVRI